MKAPWHTTNFSSALKTALERQGLSRRIREEEVTLRWEELVGTAIANHASPKRLRDGVLWLEVKDAAWRQELHLMRSGLIERINAGVGEEIVRELRLQ